MADYDDDILEHVNWCRNLRGYTQATVRARTWVLNRLRICIGRPLREAQVGHIQFWEQTVVAGLAPQSRRCYTVHVRSFYKWMITNGRMTSDPTTMLTRPKIGKPLPRPIGENDLERALHAATPKTTAMITLMSDCGLRCLEVSQLCWSDITVADGQTWLTVRNGKGARDRVVPVGEKVQRALRRHGTKARGPVFLGRDGHAIKPHSVSQIVNGHLRRCGVSSTAHKLRARYATLAASVVDTPLVAQLCGWESLDTARHYVKPDRERTAQLVMALDAMSSMPRPRPASVAS